MHKYIILTYTINNMHTVYIHIHTCVIAELSSLLPDRDALSGAELFPESTGLLRQGTGCGLGGGGRGVQSPARAHQGRRGDGVTDRQYICIYIPVVVGCFFYSGRHRGMYVHVHVRMYSAVLLVTRVKQCLYFFVKLFEILL